MIKICHNCFSLKVCLKAIQSIALEYQDKMQRSREGDFIFKK